MPRKSKNEFSIHGDTIYIKGPHWEDKNSLGMATYREDYYKELTTHTWSLTESGYITNQALGGVLHRYMMKKWYGEDVVTVHENRKKHAPKSIYKQKPVTNRSRCGKQNDF